MGAITDQERYAQLIDIWGHARKQVTEDLMAGLENDYRDDEGKPVPPKTSPGTSSEVSQPHQHDGHQQGPRLTSTRCASSAACAA